MKEPRWLTGDEVVALHGEQLAIVGGPNGVRDIGLLQSTIARSINRWVYRARNAAELAAAYAFGLVKNHAFVDGNKRTGFAAMMVFLRINNFPFAPDPPAATAAMLALACGEPDEPGLADCIAHHWPAGAHGELGADA